jgi:phospholipid transport system substrate-binding protein
MRHWRVGTLAAGLAAATMIASGTAAKAADTRSAQSPAPAAATATAPAARAVIEQVLRDVTGILRDKKLPQTERTGNVKAIAEATIDFETMGRLAMGANYRDLTEARRAEFTQEFRQHVINTYGHFTEDYTDQDLVIAADVAEARGDWTVQTKIVGMKDGARQELAKVDYRLRQTAGKWKVIDITIEGVSMMANFRAQFQDIMTSGGIDKVLKLLREKNAAGAGAPSSKNG